MSVDPTEEIRRIEQARLNAEGADRKVLQEKHGQVWTTTEMQDDFTVIGFGAPLVVVVRKADNVKGSLYFQHSPRYYFSFSPHKG